MTLNRFLERRSKPFHFVAALLLVFLLGVADYLNGPDVSLIIFYGVPVFLASWYAGRRAGLWMCAASGLAWLAGAYATAEHFTSPVIPYWNAAVRFGFMLILAHLVASFKRSLEHERELAAAEIERARRHAHPFTVAFLDVDDFKQVNDRHGHSAGDRLLKAVADTIRQSLRAVDSVARLGGDEFAVLMPETGEAAAQVVIRRVRRQLMEVARREGLPVTFSVGVVTWDAAPTSVDEMLRAADSLMYTAKRLGKNTVRHVVSTAPANAA